MVHRQLIVIHGVNYFDEALVKADVSTAAATWGISSADISMFNWDI
jgi:hypothetical protein